MPSSCRSDGPDHRLCALAPAHLVFGSYLSRPDVGTGGASLNPSKNWGDVWHSPDGKQWEELKSEICWTSRHELSAFVFQDKLSVAGGLDKALNDDVWLLTVASDYFRVQRGGDASK